MMSSAQSSSGSSFPDPTRRPPTSKIKKDLHPPSPSHSSPLARSLSRFSTSRFRALSSSQSNRAAPPSLDSSGFDSQEPPALDSLPSDRGSSRVTSVDWDFRRQSEGSPTLDSPSSDGRSSRVTWIDWDCRSTSQVRSQYVGPSSHHTQPYPNEVLDRENSNTRTSMRGEALPEIPETTSPAVSNEPPRELRIRFELDERTVVAGTVEDSIRFLVKTHHDIFRTLFIQSFPLFTTAPELLGLFDRLLESSSSVQHIGIRSLRQDWLHELDSSDIAQIRSSLQSHTGTALREDVEVVMASKSQPAPSVSRSSLSSGSVSRPASDSLAAALTTLEAKLFSQVTYVDCMTYLRASLSMIPFNIRVILDTRIKIKNWVIFTILQARDSSSARATTCRYFVQMALRCHKIGNFSSAFAIAGALHSSNFNNLPITRPRARQRSDELERLDELYTLTAYRKSLEKRNGPCIPVLDTHLWDWTASFQSLHIVDDGWVDYRCCAEIRSAMESILCRRSHPPDAKVGHDLDTMSYLDSRLNRNWETIDLDQLGREYEEKERDEDKLRAVGFTVKPRR